MLDRESTETTGGKILFLELRQMDPSNVIPKVRPSIRFHHSMKYWHRIEGQSSGFHFKTGNLASDAYVRLYASAYNIGSSARWKANIQPIDNALEKILQLQGVYFDWKDTGQHDIGLIAEEVGKVIPEVVTCEENGKDANGLDYSRLVAVLVESVKEQQRQIETLKQDIERLKRGTDTI